VERLASEPDIVRGIFAAIADGKDDEENLVLWRGRHVLVLMNLYPYNNGHLLIVPNREIADYELLTSEERTEIAEVTARCIGWLRAALSPDGFNVGMNLGVAAGAGIPEHLHVHVVPRWSGDTNFMPVAGEVKVIPESVRDTFEKLQRVVR
jgi:ATP adenylyltransferase